MELLLPLLIVALFVMMLMQMMRQRKQMKQIEQLQDQIGPGERIMTTAGLHATVVAVGEGTVDLQIAPGVVTTWDRRIIRERLEDGSAPAGAADDVVEEGDRR